MTEGNLAAWAAPFDYAYDPNGNRTSNTNGLGSGSGYQTDWYTDGLSSRLGTVDPAGGGTLYPTWDAAGNMSSDGAGLWLNHHLDGGLASASHYPLFGTYTSNAQRQRTAKTVLDFFTFSFTYEFWMYDERGGSSRHAARPRWPRVPPGWVH